MHVRLEERTRGVAMYTATAASGFSFGLIIGGLLTAVDWHLTFAVPVPVAVGLLLAGRRLIAPDAPRPVEQRGRFDVLGAVTLTSGHRRSGSRGHRRGSSSPSRPPSSSPSS